MADYTITYDGVPFRVRGAQNRKQAEEQLNLAFQDPVFYNEKLTQRKAKLLEMGINVDANFATEGMGGGEKFLVGAGRTFTETGRGIQQMWYGLTGNEDKVRQLEADEANARHTFDQLDSEGIGAEDLGQLAPELLAFVGSGGASLTSLGLRGAALGASKSTVEGESRTTNAIVSGLLSAGVAGGARGVASMFQRGAAIGGAALSGLQRLAGNAKTPGQLANNLSQAMGQAQHLANSKDAMLRKVGEEGLAQLRPLIQKMNSTGKESVFRSQLNQLFQASTKQVDQSLSLDLATFVRGLDGVSKGELVKQLGRTYGARVDQLRNVFIEMGKHADDIPPETAHNVLRGIMSSDSAAAIAARISELSAKGGGKPGVMAGLLNTLQQTAGRAVNAAAASAGPEVGDIVDEVRRDLSRIADGIKID